jgi:hypothetical protein
MLLSRGHRTSGLDLTICFWCFPSGQRCHRWQSDSCEERTSAGMMVGDGTLKGPVTWWNLSFWERFLARHTTELYPEAERLRPNLEWLQMTYPNSLQVNELCFCGAVVDSWFSSTKPSKTPRSRAKSREDKEVQACTWKVSLSSHSHWRSQGVTDGSASMSIIPQKNQEAKGPLPPQKINGLLLQAMHHLEPSVTMHCAWFFCRVFGDLPN